MRILPFKSTIVAVGPNELSTMQGMWPGCSCYVRPLTVLLREAVSSVLHGLFGGYRYRSNLLLHDGDEGPRRKASTREHQEMALVSRS